MSTLTQKPQSPTSPDLHDRLPAIVQQLADNAHAHQHLQHLNRVYLPNREVVVTAIALLRQLLFPGYFGEQGLTTANLAERLTGIARDAAEKLNDQVRCCLRYREQIPGASTGEGRCEECNSEALRIVSEFFERLPAVRDMLADDVQAAFDGDPAAQSTDETIFSYPGLFALTVQRLAHELFTQNVPLLPRMMTEYAHSLTGIDIHPGAALGRRLFIDHGTGVVIGETTQIGDNVKIYQGVTLGALAPAFGQALRGQKRHPTIEDDVTIYAGATILGGYTVIGRGAVIGGNVFVTTSVPPLNQVTADPPKLKFRDRRPKGKVDVVDFQI